MTRDTRQCAQIYLGYKRMEKLSNTTQNKNTKQCDECVLSELRNHIQCQPHFSGQNVAVYGIEGNIFK